MDAEVVRLLRIILLYNMLYMIKSIVHTIQRAEGGAEFSGPRFPFPAHC